MKNRLCFFCLILSFITFLSCNFGVETFPYLIEELETSSYSEKGLFEHLGLRFKILNTGTKSIEKITVAFTVFDSVSGKNPFITSNYLEAEFSGTIQPKESKTFEISFDDKVNFVPNHLFRTENFYVKSIKYKDGSAWKDIFASYSISEEDL